MARDYAKQKNKRGKSASTKRRASSARSKHAAPGWFWLVTGVVLGLFVAGLFYLKDHNQLFTNLRHLASRKQHTSGHHHHATKSKKQRAHNTLPKPRFDFYTMLPKMQVSVNENNKSGTNTKSATGKSASASATEHCDYVLQIASFKNYKDADTLKAKLILTGYNVAIKASKKNGTTWHRVFVGPYQSKTAAMRARRDLKQQHLFGLVLQERG